jgi:hypothetical protein
MYATIDQYLGALKDAMKGADPALVQDAQADAREHLSTAMQVAREAEPALNEADTLQRLIDEYGSPDETAAAYKEVERRTSPGLKRAPKPETVWGRIFGVYVDPRTWGSLLFMLIAFVTGIVYFTWGVTGAALSISFLILIIGLPFALLFLLSVQGLALLEGRLVEALLGVRMPRRPLFARAGMKWLERLKALLTDRHTWLSLLYMILQMPLGVLYFSLNVILLTLALSLMAAPFAQLIWHLPLITNYGQHYFLPLWGLALAELGGILVLTGSMHLARAIGWLHGRYAKWMLVSE